MAGVHHRLAKEVTLAVTPFPLALQPKSGKEEEILRLQSGMMAHCSVPYSLIEQQVQDFPQPYESDEDS